MCGCKYLCKIHTHLYFIPYLCVFVVVFCRLQGEPHRARCDDEEAAGGGLEDETEVPAGDGEKLPWTGGGAGEEGKPQLKIWILFLQKTTTKIHKRFNKKVKELILVTITITLRIDFCLIYLKKT